MRGLIKVSFNDKEIIVLLLIAEGKTNEEIGKQLF